VKRRKELHGYLKDLKGQALTTTFSMLERCAWRKGVFKVCKILPMGCLPNKHGTANHSLWEASPAVLPIAAWHDQHHVHGHLWRQPLATRATTARESGKPENPSLCPAFFPFGLLA